ncbi:MAG: fused MFS/spermidine synthase [Candidatus Abawacabacteria bacterium]|nr:fused MFS/spermidine synthase [Candidatus Abawacabacteria bacterium]
MRSHRFLLWTTFISGMSLMALEINASRILAPYFGTSLFVWSSIIGIVLLALSIGYYFGGKMADKYPRSEMLYGILWAVGIWMMVLPWLSTFLLNLITQQGISVSLLISAIVISIVLFLPPCTLMGMVSPYVLKLYADHFKELGREAGTLYAISTLGSLIGTFLPSLVTIPLIGSLRTTLFFACVLLITATIGLGKKWLIVFPIIAALLLIFAKPAVTNAYTVYQTESSYGYIHVYDHNDIRFLQLDAPYGVHSIKRADSLFTQNYWDYYTVIPYYLPVEKTLLLGVAGGNISTLLSHYFPQMQITGVEIDPAIIKTAQQYFDLDKPNLKLVEQDARSFLHQTDEDYDLIIMDAYHNLNIPVHLSTKEFFAEAKSHLTNNGLLAINVAHSGPGSKLDSYLAATLHSIFPYVYTIDTNNGYNTVLIGSQNAWVIPSNISQIQANYPELYHIWRKYPPIQITDFDLNLIQTDDSNILELIAGEEAFHVVKK